MSRHGPAIALSIVVLAGALLRLVALGHVPAGLNADEASSGVEALSLLQTGMDRWGNRWPVWFPAWGSGMNALYTYIAMPVIVVFGLSVTSLRAVGAAFGILTLPVTYQATRLYFGRPAALAATALLAVLPWHVMSSRWALDSNLLPFFFTLGLYTVGKGLAAGGRWPIMAFLPWAIGIYAYPVGLLPIGTSAILILILFRRAIAPWRRQWAIGVLAAFVVALPFLLFLAKNQLAIAHFPFEDHLPFSIPVLSAGRLSQIHQPLVTTLFDNLTFILGGYRDGLIWHQSVFFLPLTGAMPLLTLTGAALLALRRPRAPLSPVILIVLASAVIPACLLPLHLTRFNWFYIPSLMVVAHLIVEVASHAPSPLARRLAIWGPALYFTLFTACFVPYYFLRYNDEILALDVNLGNGFRVGLQEALETEIRLAKADEPVFVDVGTVHPYLYVLFFGLADIANFQATRQMRVQDGVYRVSRFGRFVFEREALPENRDFVFVSRTDRMPCGAPEIASNGPRWVVGRCGVSR